jgi:hypothetical protein
MESLTDKSGFVSDFVSEQCLLSRQSLTLLALLTTLM